MSDATTAEQRRDQQYPWLVVIGVALAMIAVALIVYIVWAMTRPVGPVIIRERDAPVVTPAPPVNPAPIAPIEEPTSPGVPPPPPPADGSTESEPPESMTPPPGESAQPSGE